MSSRPSSIPEVATTVEADGTISIANGNIKKKILKEGTGPTPTDRADVTVHYTGRLLDGTVFDSSKKRNDPFKFKIGTGQVIKGWDQGVATMKVGETAILTCSPEFAYGARGSPPTIPPNATLEFEVELLSFDNTQKVTEDGGVKKSIKQPGVGHARPNDHATVVVKYTGRVKGSDKNFVEVNEPKTLQLGTDPTQIWGLEEGIKNMHEGERSTFFVQPSYGLPAGDASRNIPPNAELEFDVELLSLKKAKESSEMTFDEKLAYMTSLKEFGNGLYKLGLLDRACKIYTKVVKDVFPYDGNLDDEQKKKVQAVKISAISNNTLCKLKTEDWEGVLGHAKAGLEIDPKHVKCLYYRAQAYNKLGQLTEAEADLRVALEVDPKNRDALVLLNSIKAKVKAMKEKEKKAFGGFFGKVKLISDEEEKKLDQEAEEAKNRAAQGDSSDDAEMDSGDEQ